MSVHLHFLLILTGLTGINSITTVSKVSVKAGASISIPCLYDSQYINHVKYLCEGSSWTSCSHAVKTNQPNSAKFSISDDKSQRIFTVTIKDLTTDDSHYWCAVEIDGGADVREHFQLSVTRGPPGLYVAHQEITRFIGDDVTINCHHPNSGEINWCKLGGACVTSGSKDGTTVTIRRLPTVLTVAMSGVRTESSGWYLCIRGDLQMPVHLTVTVKPNTTTVEEQPTTTTVEEQPTTTTVEEQPTTTQSGHTNTPPTTVQRNESPPDHLKIFGIRLSVLILVVMVTAFILFMFKRHKQTKEESSATATVKYEAEEEATYVNVASMGYTSEASWRE